MPSKEYLSDIYELTKTRPETAPNPMEKAISIVRRYRQLSMMGVGIAWFALLAASQPPEARSTATFPTPISRPLDSSLGKQEVASKAPQLFKNTVASEIAYANNIDAGDFFLFKTETLDKLDAFLGPDLYPIYPPSVIQYQDLIYKLTDEFNVPPNVIATIMSIESAGNTNTPSSAGAQGLFQVMPDHFYTKFGKEYVDNNPQIMTDPYTNGKLGMEFFAKDCLTTARDELAKSKYGPNHVITFARALTAYNAGPSTIKANFDELPEETKFYGDHFIRFALTAQIAKGLRDRGYTDQQTVQALTLNSNIELDARMKAVEVLHNETIKANKGYPYAEYQTWLKELSLPIPGVDPKTGQSSELGQKVHKIYDNYKNNPTYLKPLSVGLRSWVNMGGISLLDKENINTITDNYLNMDTKKRTHINFNNNVPN